MAIVETELFPEFRVSSDAKKVLGDKLKREKIFRFEVCCLKLGHKSFHQG